jgi:hypothetical protein
VIVSSIETRASWVVACVALLAMACSFGAPWIAVVALKAIAADLGGARSTPALAGSLSWFGVGFGGIVMGQVAHHYGVRWTVMFGAVMICVGPRDLLARRIVAALCGPWPVHRLSRQWRHQCAALRLCEPLVRSPPRLGAHLDLQRRLRSRRGVAADLRTGHCGLWLAADHVGLRPRRNGCHRAVGRNVLASATGFLACPDRSIRRSKTRTGARLAAQPGLFHAVRRRFPVLHTDGTAAGAPRRVLLGPRHLAGPWRCHALGGPGLRRPQPADLGFVRLFTVSALFGLGFSGLVPAYVLTLRELYPARDARWRVPTSAVRSKQLRTDAVPIGPVCCLEFPDNREINRDFEGFQAPGAMLASDYRTTSMICNQIPTRGSREFRRGNREFLQQSREANRRPRDGAFAPLAQLTTC